MIEHESRVSLRRRRRPLFAKKENTCMMILIYGYAKYMQLPSVRPSMGGEGGRSPESMPGLPSDEVGHAVHTYEAARTGSAGRGIDGRHANGEEGGRGTMKNAY
jgi:hypothetical protein